ncbi:putative signal transducing protein [Mongoliitalea daihaiensis]|uniref:putative signal transducing protein n=1 Tax=Mongoliitalea daihaiensis TaxID=2782006 RepID=UPI001F3AD366|nr:DUF2007 domain-containing protein [Mongoliitalea daihaiensis]UJP65370.1 DUF2007 domain-containing protein [Mongoliitalea daihaiensis]
MGNWKKIFADGSPVRAEIVKSILEERGITAVILNKKETAYQIHGHYEVMVAEQNQEEALTIVQHEITF